MEVRVLWRQGFSIREISRRTGRSRNTVRSYLRSDAAEPVYGPRSAKPSKLDPFKPYLEQRARAAHPVRLPETVLVREITEQGYEGSITILRDYLRTLKPAAPADPVIRF